MKTELDDALRGALERQIRHYIDWAARMTGRTFPYPKFDVRLRGSVAGKAHGARWYLQFNPVLLRENRAHFLHHTVGHEVAHLVVHALAGGRRAPPHGAPWRALMRAFGLDTRATHRYDVTRVRSERSPFVYHCACIPEIRVGHVRHARVRHGVKYLCRRCKTPLRFSHRCD